MWQPIETAPRNQTFLAVLNCAGEQTICTMRWPVAEAKNSRPDGKTFHVERVTHWMPLPDLPGAQPAQKAVAYLDIGAGGYMDIGTDLTDEELATLPKGRHMLGVIGTYGVDGYVQAQPAPSVPEGCPPHAEIYVGDGMFVWCDWKDFDLVKKYNWNLTTRNRSGCLYAQSWDCHNTSERKRITMHGLIMPAPDGQFVDHINGNGLDNRRENLRLVTHQQNSFNQKHHGGSSKFKGVSIDRSSGSWRAYITVDGKRKHLGRHGTEIDAAKAYDMAAKEFFGEYAKLNLESAPSPTTLDET